jgi:hypothetical protein
MNVINSAYPNNIRPKYVVHGGAYTIKPTIHIGASGFWYIYNPIASTVKVFIKRIICRSAATTALVTLTAPRLSVTRFSYTTPPGDLGSKIGYGPTPIAPAKMESVESSPSASCLWYGMGDATLTVGATCTCFLINGAMTAVGTGNFSEQQYNATVGEELILAAGEGLSFQQIDDGTASDTRKIVIDVVWEEGT